MAHMKSIIENGLKDMSVSRLTDEQLERKTEDTHYPPGLKITLDKKTIDTLGLSVKDCKVGDRLCLEAKAEILLVRKDKNPYGPSSETIELQITHIGLEDEEDK